MEPRAGPRSARRRAEVVEYRPYEDGMLQAEVRIYAARRGPLGRGPYWYFRYHEGGKQKKIYLGRTDNPEGELARKRKGLETSVAYRGGAEGSPPTRPLGRGADAVAGRKRTGR